MRAMLNKVVTMKLTNFKGKDVTVAASQLRGAMICLAGPPNHFSSDMVHKIITIMQTSSHPEFNQLFQSMDNLIKLKQKIYGVDEVLAVAESRVQGTARG